METYQIYTGGEFIETSHKLNVTCSHNNETIATTYLAGKKELDTAITRALEAEPLMKNLASFRKYEILSEIAAKLKANSEKLAKILSLEASKPLKYAISEINRAIQVFIIAAEESKRLPKEYLSLDWTQAGDNKEAFIKYFPVGLIAGIAPFNFPLNLAVHKIAPAIAAGNPIILKPARATPLSTLELAKIINTTALPKGAFSVLPMDRESGNQLITDERFKLLTFTGSPEIGWKMKQQCGKKKIILELGGNAGVIITPTTDIQSAVKKCVIGGFAYQGQVCIHVQRIFVHETIFDSFKNQFINQVQMLKSGEPNSLNTDICSMIDTENAIRVESWVNEAIENKALLLCGGKRNNAFFEPTVLTDTNRTMKVFNQEIFGPVVILEKYRNFSDAVNFVNDSEFGLQAGVFTNQIDEMNYAFNQIETGGVIINDVPTFRVDHMPYGGIKNSGLGREGVKYAITEMMEPKLLVKNYL